MMQSLKASDYRYQRPKRLSSNCVAALLEAANLSDSDRKSVLERAYSSPSYREAYATLLNNYSNFNFLLELMTDANRAKIIPILQEYGMYPGYRVKITADGKLWVKVNFHEALRINPEEFSEWRAA